MAVDPDRRPARLDEAGQIRDEGAGHEVAPVLLVNGIPVHGMVRDPDHTAIEGDRQCFIEIRLRTTMQKCGFLRPEAQPRLILPIDPAGIIRRGDFCLSRIDSTGAGMCDVERKYRSRR